MAVHPYLMESYPVIKRDELVAQATTWMKPKISMLSERSQAK